MSTPELLVVGHVTCDEVDGTTRLGGAAAYAARAAALLGVRTALVTAAPPDHPLLDDLRGAAGLEVHCRPSPAITTFALEYRGPCRRLILRARAEPLAPDDVPPAWRSAPVAYLGPVAGECDRRLVAALAGPGRSIAVGLQGWLRTAVPGPVEPALADEALHPPARLSLAIFSDQDHPDAQAVARAFTAAGIRVALTRAAAGALIFDGEGPPLAIPATPARELDPTGAGDVFGVVLTLALARGMPLVDAADLAARAAARVVEGPALGRLPEAPVPLPRRI